MAKLVTGLFWVAVALDVLVVSLDLTQWHWVIKPLLMPLLLACLLARSDHRDRTVRWLAMGLALAWLADIALLPSGSAWFLTGVALFGVMQVCYLRVFVAAGALGRMRRRWPVPAVLFVVLVVVVAFLGPAMGWLAVPVTAYALLLTSMAALAQGMRPAVAVGGPLFLLSDMLIGLDLAGIDFVGREPAIMATYTLAQFLIVTGCLSTFARARDGSGRVAHGGERSFW